LGDEKEEEIGKILILEGILGGYVAIAGNLLTFSWVELEGVAPFLRTHMSSMHNNNLGKSWKMR